MSDTITTGPMPTLPVPAAVAASTASAPAVTDPWMQQALDYFMSNVGPRRTRAINSNGSVEAKLAAAQRLGHKDELRMYADWLMNHPRTAPIPTAPAPVPVAAPVGPTRDEQLSSARGQAQQKAELWLRSQGYDPQQYMPLINAEYDRVASNLLPTDDPRNAFGENIASSVIQGEQNRGRNEALRTVNDRFTTGHESKALPSSLLDDAISSILGEQRSSAQQYLDRGKARGIYNDVGYNTGVNSINNAASAARSDLSSLGSSVLDKYRGNLDEIGDEAYNAASGFNLGDKFSLDPYTSQYDDTLSRANSNASGDLRNLLGGKNFFDLSSLTQKAGQAQGALNLRDADVATALAERKRRNSTNRGLGSQGAF